MKYRCLIIGLGQIGMGYDLTLPKNEAIFTHCRALSRHPKFEILGAVDSSLERRLVFKEHYGKKAYGDISHAMKEFSPDLVVISSPTDSHYAVVKQVLDQSKPMAILCEKPLAYELTDAINIVQSCANLGVRLFVNYHRRSDPGVIEIQKRIFSGSIARPIKGNVWYSKGLLHNGSHFVNLMQFWLSSVKKHSIISNGRLWNDEDPEPDVYVEFEQGNIVFSAAWEESFSYYTAEMISPSGRMLYDRGGELIQWHSIIDDPKFNGYTILKSDPEIIKNGMNRYQYHVAEQLSLMLEGKEAALCSGSEALETQEVIQKILNSRINKKR